MNPTKTVTIEAEPIAEPTSETVIEDLYGLSDEELTRMAAGSDTGSEAGVGDDLAVDDLADDDLADALLDVSVDPIAPLDRGSSEERAYAAAEAADDRKGEDILILDVSEISYLAEYFLIITAFSRTQVRAIAESVIERLADEFGVKPNHTSGKSDATWFLLDYGDLIVHVMLPQEREFYNLEAFWNQGRRIEFVSER